MKHLSPKLHQNSNVDLWRQAEQAAEALLYAGCVASGAEAQLAPQSPFQPVWPCESLSHNLQGKGQREENKQTSGTAMPCDTWHVQQCSSERNPNQRRK